MNRSNKDMLGAGLVGFLAGKGHVRPIRSLLWLGFVALAVGALGVALAVHFWPEAAVVVAVVAFVRHHRRRRPSLPASPPPQGTPRRALPPARPTRDDLDAAFAEGYNRGQREAHKVERSWGRPVPAYDPDDPDAF